MPRGPREILPGIPHHITLRGNNRRKIFSYAKDYRRFLFYVREALADVSCRLHAACLMPNHVHLQLTPACGRDLSGCVKRFAQRYAMARNRIRRSMGKLFQERFHSRPILDAQQMAVTTAYIELNAWRAGLVADPLDYRWSSYAIHAGSPERSGIPAGMLTPSPWYIALADTPEGRASAYRDLAMQFYIQSEDIEDESRASGDAMRLERPDRTRAW